MWGFVSYDPELDLVYYGTANPGAWNPEQRPGDNKWTCGHLRPRPGHRRGGLVLPVEPARPARLRRHQREHAGRPAIGWRRRAKVLLHPDRNGYVYVLDRATGEVLSADPFVPITTGQRRRPEDRPAHLRPREGAALRRGDPRHLSRRRRAARTGSRRRSRRAPGCCTSRTRTSAMDYEGIEANYIAGTPYLGADVQMYAGPGRAPRRVHGLGSGDAVQESGGIDEDFPVWSGALATAGDLVFYGTMEGWFKAVDARTGALAVAVQDRLGHHRPAGDVPRPRRQAVRRHLLRRRRLGRRDRRAAISMRATAPRPRASSTP